MKKLFLSLSLLAGLVFFNACTTDVELYSEYKDIPIIYGLLDASQDTNFIRINRAFSGDNDHPINAANVALIADSCNYPGKLRAYIVKYKKGYGGQYLSTGDTLELDTITIHDKEEGIFYSPNQKVYWTNQHLDVNTETAKYRYKIFVYKDNDTITSETNIVGGDGFKIITENLGFMAEENDNSGKIKFTLADNAVFYDAKMVFYYKESVNGGPLTDKQVSYSFGVKIIEDLGQENERIYYVSYGMNTLFNLLEDAIGGDTVINENHPNVFRYFDEKPMKIFLSAGGDELYNYIQINSQTGYAQTIPDYTNINGGYGVLSSRINKIKEVSISATTQRDLYGKPWGFVQQ
jgi:hypothetical protein